ncbi:MAG: hypothetical protein A2014_12505 [Spirochaetes bacterium GWF1_49_6]|nr:MAG: hypothetical protein A2014_12505 [Spirochaetes bacterium GWF1_49_6]
MNCSAVMVVRIEKRAKEAVKVQEVLTKYGCNISARFGIHETGMSASARLLRSGQAKQNTGGQCSDIGMVLLCLDGSPDELGALGKELSSIPGVKVNSMKLD